MCCRRSSRVDGWSSGIGPLALGGLARPQWVPAPVCVGVHVCVVRVPPAGPTQDSASLHYTGCHCTHLVVPEAAGLLKHAELLCSPSASSLRLLPCSGRGGSNIRCSRRRVGMKASILNPFRNI